MAPLPAYTSNGMTNLPQQPPLLRAKSASELQRDEARIVFDKTIDGQYRHGKTGYRQVGALFLTWAADDMQCKTTEVGAPDHLHGLNNKIPVLRLTS